MNPRNYDSYVFQIQKQGSMTKAAAALGISQPALSSGLTNLEKELGFQIFNRRTVPISLTPEGRLYMSYIDRLQVLEEDFERRLDSLKKEAGQSVTIGGAVAYIESLVAEAMTALLTEHPEYRVEIKVAPISELIEMAERGTLQCFISTSGELPEEFERVMVKREKLYLCIPASDILNRQLAEYQTSPGREGKRFDYSVLSGRRFILMEDGQPMQDQMNRFLKEYGLPDNSRIRVNQTSTAVNLAARGEGLCIASEDALKRGVDLSNLRIYSLPETISAREIYIAYLKGLYLPEACKKLINKIILTGGTK
ncbi:MAG: LysR family transcriptional regulator [Oscillospiraceae bacterium]|nr:LysR family transcriptional regulator [Oscillospiraceae bacterium]